MADDENEVPEEGAQEADTAVEAPPEPEVETADADDTDMAAAMEAQGDDMADELLAQEDPPEITRTAKDLDAVYDIPVQLSAVLGRANMQVSQLLKLGRGAVVELDRKVGEAIDIYVNNRLVARGEVVVVEERLGITMTEIIKSDRVN